LFLVSILEKCLSPDNTTLLLGTPYMTNIKDILKCSNFIDNEELRKLFILFNTKWSKKENLYDETILTYLNKMSDDTRIQLYNIMNAPIENKGNFYNDMEKILKIQLNMQECVKKLKRERR